MALPEHRKNHFMGISPAEWIMIGFVIIGASFTYGMFAGDVKANGLKSVANEKKLAEIPTQIVEAVQSSEARVMGAMKEMDQRNSESIRILQEDIKQLLRQTR